MLFVRSCGFCVSTVWMSVRLSYIHVVWSDDNTAFALTENLIQHSKMKDVEIVLYFVCEKVKHGQVFVNFVSAFEQLTNILTINAEKVFLRCRKKLGVFFALELNEFDDSLHLSCDASESSSHEYTDL